MKLNNDLYAVYVNDEYYRSRCSSGGVFGKLAAIVIEKGGYVFGASLNSYDNIWSCSFKECSNKEELNDILGSKYIYSNINNVYLKIKKLLINEKKVLFSGTPCQVAGLKKYLIKEYANLITLDFICHGVPYPVLLNKYIHDLENKYKSNVYEIKFRDKRDGWIGYSIIFKFVNSEEFVKKSSESSYMKLFLSDNFLKESCFTCEYKNENRMSDLTIGDFWGIEHYSLIEDNEIKKGISLVKVNTNKGNAVLDELKNSSFQIKIDKTYFDISNIYYRKSPQRPFNKSKYEKMLKNCGCDLICKSIDKTKNNRKFIKKVFNKTGLLKVKVEKRENKLPKTKFCYSCYACFNVCPNNSIEMLEDDFGIRYPKINVETCINCNMCQMVCPRENDI